MLGLLLDCVIILVLLKLIAGLEDESWGKALVVAIMAGGASFGLTYAAEANQESALLILLGGLVAIGIVVGLCVFILFDVPIGRSLGIGAAYMGVKIAIALAFLIPAIAAGDV